MPATGDTGSYLPSSFVLNPVMQEHVGEQSRFRVRFGRVTRALSLFLFLSHHLFVYPSFLFLQTQAVMADKAGHTGIMNEKIM